MQSSPPFPKNPGEQGINGGLVVVDFGAVVAGLGRTGKSVPPVMISGLVVVVRTGAVEVFLRTQSVLSLFAFSSLPHASHESPPWNRDTELPRHG